MLLHPFWVKLEWHSDKAKNLTKFPVKLGSLINFKNRHRSQLPPPTFSIVSTGIPLTYTFYHVSLPCHIDSHTKIMNFYLSQHQIQIETTTQDRSEFSWNFACFINCRFLYYPFLNSNNNNVVIIFFIHPMSNNHDRTKTNQCNMIQNGIKMYFTYD